MVAVYAIAARWERTALAVFATRSNRRGMRDEGSRVSGKRNIAHPATTVT